MGITKTKYPASVWQPFEIFNNHWFRVLEPLESKNQRVNHPNQRTSGSGYLNHQNHIHREPAIPGALGKRRVRVKYLRAPGISKGGTGDQRTTGSRYVKNIPGQRTVSFRSFKPPRRTPLGVSLKRTGICIFLRGYLIFSKKKLRKKKQFVYLETGYLMF
jgi:hypothetical protein